LESFSQSYRNVSNTLESTRGAAGTFQTRWKASRRATGTFQTHWKASRRAAGTFQTRWKACCIAARSFQTHFYCIICNKTLKYQAFIAKYAKQLFNSSI
jgi:hypothetical protein